MFYNTVVIPAVGIYFAAYKSACAFQDVSDLVRQLHRRRAAR